MPMPLHRRLPYRVIEAGQLLHRLALGPVLERGLSPGDDAVLLAVGPDGIAEPALAAALGLPLAALASRLQRLVARQLLDRRAMGPTLVPELHLTERGQRVADTLAAHWQRLEAALAHDLSTSERRALKSALRSLRRVAAGGLAAGRRASSATPRQS